MDNLKLKVTDPTKHFQNPIVDGNDKFTTEQKAKLATVSKQFESMLNSMMLKSMTDSTKGLMGSEGGYGNDMFGSMFEGELASFMTKSKSLGIAESMYKKITGEDFPTDLNAHKIKASKNVPINYASTSKKATVTPADNALDRLSKYDKIVDEASKLYGIDKNIVKSIILTESAANEKAVSSANAKGLMQLIDPTAEAMGVKNPFDARQNIFGGTKYISQMLKRYDGNVEKALAAYNAGPGNVDKFNGIPPFQETQNYVARVSGYLNYFRGTKTEDASSTVLANSKTVTPETKTNNDM